MKSLLNLGLLFLTILFIVAVNLFIAVAIASVLIVPFTFLYSKLIGKSYNYVIDQSNMLYKLNKFGQWMLFFGTVYILYTLLR